MVYNDPFFSLTNPIFYKLHKISPEFLDVSFLLSNFEKHSTIQDLSANPSSNINSKSIPRLKYEILQPMMKFLTFKKLYERHTKEYGVTVASKDLEHILNGSLYLHDSSAYIIPYCLGVDFAKIIEEGIPNGKLPSLPPKKPKSFINQVKEAIIELSNEFAGAIAFPTLIISYTYIYLKYYYPNTTINEKEVEDDFQNLIHTINREMRNGVESPFTNMSFFDTYILEELIEYVYPHYPLNLNITKQEFIDKIKEVQKIVIKFLAKGTPNGGVYPFPVLTANFILDENKRIKDQEFLQFIAEHNAKGIFNFYCSNDARKYSMCCRFQPDYKDLHFDSFGNGGINVGSIKVVTINLNRIALEIAYSENGLQYSDTQKLEKIYPLLLQRCNIAKRILDTYRLLLKEQIKERRLKYFNHNWFDLDKNFYSTIGFIGLYEMYQTLNFTNLTYEEFAKHVLQFLDETIKDFNKQHNWKYNLEQVPGESLASFLPQLDKIIFGEDKVPYQLYANQFIPLYQNFSIFDKILIEGKLFKYLSGGGISHINISEPLKPDVMINLIDTITRAGIEHFALNPVYSICEDGHFTFGKVDKCSRCGKPIKDYMTRVVGFFTYVSSWNKTRREWEFAKRVWNKIT